MNIEQELQTIKKNTADVISEKELLQKLRNAYKQKKKLRIKYGADPSAADIHLGHTVPLQKLRQFQELGHTVIFLIGDFTATIGDPSGRTKTRPPLTGKQIRKNAATYTEQVFKILDRDKTEVVFNSKWCEKMKFTDVIKLCSHYTVARMLERDDFTKRLEKKEPISMHELIYPLIQAYDSVVLKADIEVGGTDQKFNFLVAREIQRDFGQEPEIIVLLPILEGTDGKQKMSKSLNNFIGIGEAPSEMYGKLMSIPDSLLPRYYTLLLAKEVPDKLSAYEAKKYLSRKITSLYHGDKKASDSEHQFLKVFSRKEIPDNIPEISIKENKLWIVDLVRKAGFTKSKAEARRLIRQGGFKIDNESYTNSDTDIVLSDKMILKAGKRRFVKIRTHSA